MRENLPQIPNLILNIRSLSCAYSSKLSVVKNWSEKLDLVPLDFHPILLHPHHGNSDRSALVPRRGRTFVARTEKRQDRIEIPQLISFSRSALTIQ